jgi:hypothetical protein
MNKSLCLHSTREKKKEYQNFEKKKQKVHDLRKNNITNKQFNWFDPQWNPIKDKLYHAFTQAFIEEIQDQMPLNDKDKLPEGIIHGWRPLSFWFDYVRKYRQWTYWASVEFDFAKQTVYFKMQGRSTWMDWKKLDLNKASKNIFRKVTEDILTEEDIHQYKTFLTEYIKRMQNKWSFYKNTHGLKPSAFEADERYID